MKKHNSKAKLINISDIKRAINMKGPLGYIIGSCAMRLMGFCHINSLYPQYCDKKGRDFVEGAMKAYNIKFDVVTSELDYIPQTGPFIVVSNHPFGGWDGLVLYDVISSLRPDFKILTNFILSHIDALKDSFLPVNPFTGNKSLKSSLSGLRLAREHVMNGGCLGLFPSGEVSTYYGLNLYTADKDWQPAIIKLIKNCNVTILPIYFDGTNSKIFHYLGRIHPMLRTINLPNELNKRAGQTITMRIGKPISINEISDYKNLKDFGLYLRNRTYALEANIKSNNPETPIPKDVAPIALPHSRVGLIREIISLEKDSKLFEVSNYQCFLANPERIPKLIRELGRKREESFREVGEGCNQALDIDKYDSYYKHLILWDKQKKRIAGAYRLGIGEEIIPKYGIDGFYSQTLFCYSRKFTDILSKTIELGRSFVAAEYKKEPLPLILLIKGLMYTVMKYRKCEYFIGPVSISSWYPYFYRSLIIHYLTKNYSSEYKKMAKARHPFELNFLRTDPDALLSKKIESVEKFDKFMLRLSDNEYRLPTLVKKYIKLNCRILAFNVDKDFNYCVDGLIMLKLKEIPKDELISLAKGADDLEAILERFGYGTGS